MKLLYRYSLKHGKQKKGAINFMINLLILNSTTFTTIFKNNEVVLKGF